VIVLSFRHVTASGDLDRFWEFDPARAVVMLTHRVPGAPRSTLYDVPVCGERSPRHGHLVMSRLGADQFRIHPSRMYLETGSGCRVWVTEMSPCHARLPRSTPCDLSHAPPPIAAEMAAMLGE
jgi:hypothetical protein